ncbi:MAG: class I SAM-dependent methyltransferase [Nitrospinota bacterium]|nr:class I SAM-dependent methyltransferase [Nitrospinota bacterium]MDH5677884.1 class I SAM-dependent methyltransferase [Nitrospinota bacterium]MDH5756614.1 class I SAM-dependent methyltransferase [Nitrospinota bacterium]
MFGFIHSLVNIPFVKKMITHNRLAVRLYFNWKYRREDPYGLRTQDYEITKLDKTAALATPHGPFGSVLEIGCGEGLLTERLAPLAKAVLGVDISDTAVSRARARLAGLPNVRVERMDILTDSFEEPFDLVAASEVLYYMGLDQLPEAIEKIKNLLKPGGALLLAHARARADDESGVDLKSFGARTIHDLFIADPLFQPLDETLEPGYRITFLRKKTA